MCLYQILVSNVKLHFMFVEDFAIADLVSKQKQVFDRLDEPFPFKCLFKTKNRLTFEEPPSLFHIQVQWRLSAGGARTLPENHVYAPLSNRWEAKQLYSVPDSVKSHIPHD